MVEVKYFHLLKRQFFTKKRSMVFLSHEGYRQSLGDICFGDKVFLLKASLSKVFYNLT